MVDDKNTIYLDCAQAHLADALTPLLTEHLPNITIEERDEAFFHLVLNNGTISLQKFDGQKCTDISTPIKTTALIAQLKKIFSQVQPTYIGPYVFNYDARTLSEDGNILHLTEKEAQILDYLSTHRGEGISRDDLLKNVWGYADGIDTHTIETHIYRLRQKIEKDPVNAKILCTDDDGYHLVENS